MKVRISVNKMAHGSLSSKMLSDTDVHYLVGLLTQVPDGSDVTVELGDMVYDTAADEKRDIDITISKIDANGTRSIYRGLEVKNHGRPLDVAAVEQLCLKFKDMPDITERAIVSASGYTKGAVKKAQVHNVELLEIVDWPNPREGFNVQFEAGNALTMIEPEWLDGPHVRVNVAPNDHADLSNEFSDHLKLFTKSGEPYPGIATLNELSQHAHRSASAEAQKGVDPRTVRREDRMPVNVTVLFTEVPFIQLSSRSIPVENCVVKGSIGYLIHDKPLFRVLRQHGASKPLTGCVIVEMKNHNLMGISVSNLNNYVTALNIPYSDRVKKKVRGHVIHGTRKGQA